MVSLRLAAADGAAAARGRCRASSSTLRLPTRTARRRCCAATRCPGAPGAARATGSASSASRTASASSYLHASVRVGDCVESRRPRGTLRPATPATPPVAAASAPASAPPRCWRCCTRWPRPARRARSGGCTARATAPSTPSPPRSHALLAELPDARAARLLQPRPAPTDRPGPGLRRRRAADAATCSTTWRSRATPTPTSAARARSWRTLTAGSRAPGASTRPASTPRCSAPAAALTPGIAGRTGDRRPTRRPARRARARRSRSPAAASTVRWATDVREPARARRGLRRAGPLVVPHRRLPHLRDRPAGRCGRPTTRRRSTRPPTATCWSAVPQPSEDVVLDL